MNRTRTRALLAAAALGVATIALPIAASASSYQTCDDVPGITKIDQASGSHNGAWGTISWGGNDLDHNLADGWSLEVCLKAGNNVEVSGPYTGAGTVSTTVKQAISHIGHRLVFEEPSDDDGNDDAIDDGNDDGASNDDGETDGTDDDGTGPDDDGITDDGITDGTDDGVSNDDGETDGDTDGTDDGVSNDDGETDGTDDDGTDVLPGGEVAPVDGDDDGDATDGDAAGDDGTETAEVPVEVLPATLDSRLPNTGSDVPALVAAAALALGLGGTALVRTRRRTTSA